MANTTVSIRERIKTEGRWRWSCNLLRDGDALYLILTCAWPVVDTKSHLRVSYQILVAIEDEEVGNADDLDVGSADFLCSEKRGLIEES